MHFETFSNTNNNRAAIREIDFKPCRPTRYIRTSRAGDDRKCIPLENGQYDKTLVTRIHDFPWIFISLWHDVLCYGKFLWILKKIIETVLWRPTNYIVDNEIFTSQCRKTRAKSHVFFYICEKKLHSILKWNNGCDWKSGFHISSVPQEKNTPKSTFVFKISV